MKATQKKVTSPTDSATATLYQLSVHVFFVNVDRFEVIRDFRSLKNGGIPFPVDGSIADKMRRHHSIPGWRFSYSLCRNFPFIFLRSKVTSGVVRNTALHYRACCDYSNSLLRSNAAYRTRVLTCIPQCLARSVGQVSRDEAEFGLMLSRLVDAGNGKKACMLAVVPKTAGAHLFPRDDEPDTS
jgi:hypothetical protein